MVNPRAQIYLEWSTLKDVDLGIAMDNVIKKVLRLYPDGIW